METVCFKKYKKSGVVYATEHATQFGFYHGNKDWVNLGQGAAEAGNIEGALPRVDNITISAKQHGYAPVGGLKKLRENIAFMYNDLFRVNKKSKYSYKNIEVSGGGRIVISRIIAAMQDINVGYFVPDYTSYDGILSVFNNIKPIPIFLSSKNGFKFNHRELKNRIKQENIKALLLSNPSNPTGAVIQGDDLKKLVELAKKEKFYLIIDEFYFNFIYNKKFELVSSAKFIDDIENSGIIIICGLSKAWRYSGWRVCWAIGPQNIMEIASRVGSFLDGGANNPLQKSAIKLVGAKNILKESRVIQKLFRKKRDYMMKRFKKMDFIFGSEPDGAFYFWLNLKKLPKEINNGMKFFERMLKEKVIVVPGKFFDLNPHKLRKEENFTNYIRIGYGPEIKILKEGIDRIERVVRSCKK
ncbi:MAG: pyridoxal phosphate-dependent aminotransferase [Patescibacteria group bacterium]|nr:pyridoxal phosphate-dependent aminotransferase [Patescibacteria group bacterium]